MSLKEQRARLVKEWSAVAGVHRGKINVAELLESEAAKLLKDSSGPFSGHIQRAFAAQRFLSTLEGKIEYGDRAIEGHLKNDNIEYALHSILNNIKERNNKIIRDYCS
jgi:hypothetical protein